MLQQPSFPYPYMEAVDVNSTDEMIFKCRINPRDVVTDYIFRLKNFEDDSVIYSKSATLDTPVYGGVSDEAWLEIPVSKEKLKNGIDYVWNVSIFNRKSSKASFTIRRAYSNYADISDDTAKKTVENSVKVGMLMCAKYNDSEYVGVITEVNKNSSDYTIRYDTANAFVPCEGMMNNEAFVYGNGESYDYYFKARSEGVVDFSVETEIISPNIDVQGSYSQEESVGFSYYQFNLYLGAELVDSTGDVVSSNIHYGYNGLEAGKEYTLELTVVDDEHRHITVEKKFRVNYKKHKSLITPTVDVKCYEMSVDLDFSTVISAEGQITNNSAPNYKTFETTGGGVPSSPNAISLSKEQYIYWNNINDVKPLDFRDTVQIIHWHGHEGFYYDIAELVDDENILKNISVGYNGENFYYKIGTSDIVYVNPYDKTLSAIGTVGSVVDKTALYKLEDSDILSDDDYLLFNDITYNYWWIIAIYPDKVEFVKSVEFKEAEVGE